MKIDQIRYFLAICDKGNFTRAAQTCGIKQPSLTAAIQRLERSIGGKLFDRSSSPIRLTKLGSQLLPIWKEIDVLFEKTVALVRRTEIYCPDDEAALERPKNLADGHAVELWEGDRRIALIDGKDGSSTPRAAR